MAQKKLVTGIEPVTPSLPRKCSTSEPHQLAIQQEKAYQSWIAMSRDDSHFMRD